MSIPCEPERSATNSRDAPQSSIDTPRESSVRECPKVLSDAIVPVVTVIVTEPDTQQIVRYARRPI